MVPLCNVDKTCTMRVSALIDQLIASTVDKYGIFECKNITRGLQEIKHCIFC